MKLHEVKKRSAQPQHIEYRMSKDGIASLKLFFKLTEFIPSMFDLERSMIDVH